MKIKRRTLIAILLTIFCLFLTKSFWLVQIPIKISFDVEGYGWHNVAIQLNKKFSDEFKLNRIKQASHRFNLSKEKHFSKEIYIPKAKKMRIVLERNDSLPFCDMTISNIEINNQKLIKLSAKDFHVAGAKIQTNYDKIIVKPLKNKIYITYKPRLSLKGKIDFQFEIFIIIAVLSFLLFYKLSFYIGDFKSIQNKSRIDIVFLLIFFIILFIPMLNIDKSKKSDFENRFLAEFKPLIINGGINQNFGKDFDSWFNDRFNQRMFYLNLNDKLLDINKIFIKNDARFDKEYNLLLTTVFFGYPRPQQNEQQEILDKHLLKLKRFSDYCKKKNIKLYFLIVPRHSEFFDYTVFDKTQKDKDFSEDIIEYVEKKSDIKFIYPKELMIKTNKEIPMYFSTDHHWTKKGTFICYEELMKAIKKDFPKLYTVKESQLKKIYNKNVIATWERRFFNGQTFKYLNLDKKYEKKLLNKEYLYYQNPMVYKLKNQEFTPKNEEYKSDMDEEFFYDDANNNLRTIVIGNSFAQNLVEFLPYSFKRTIRLYDNYRSWDMKQYESIIDEIKPNIIIINFQSHYFATTLNMYEEKTNKEEK